MFVENDSTRIFSTRSIVKVKAWSKRFVLPLCHAGNLKAAFGRRLEAGSELCEHSFLLREGPSWEQFRELLRKDQS